MQFEVPVWGCWDVSCQHSSQPHEPRRHVLILLYFINTIGVWICAFEPVIGASGKGVGEHKSEGCYMKHTNRTRNSWATEPGSPKIDFQVCHCLVVLPLELSKPGSSSKWRQ